MIPTHAVALFRVPEPIGQHFLGTDVKLSDTKVASPISHNDACLWDPTLCRALHTSKVGHEVFFEMKA